jgi:hypothetical protein
VAKITFYTDDDVNGKAIRIARSRGVAIVTSDEASMRGERDEKHFAYAVRKGYVLVTANIGDYVPIFRAWVAAGRNHPGMVVIPHPKAQQPAAVASALCDLYEGLEAEEMRNRMEWI